MKLLSLSLFLLAAPLAAHAQSAPPTGATGLCKDGTYTTAATKSGACRGHQGIKEWMAASSTASPAASTSTKATAAKTKTPAASAPAAAASGTPPAGATGLCKDGTYTTAASKSGACRGHQGVKEWMAASSTTTPAASTKAAMPAAPAAPAAAAPAATAAAAPAAAAKSTSSHTNLASVAAAPGGGQGLVWLNTDSNVYHCYGSQYYGKTKQGAYMSEADAKAKGAHADHNHACSK